MIGEPTLTTSKERMVPELIFSSECMPQLSKNCFESAVAIMLRFQLCSAHYTALQMKNSTRSASATIQSPRKCDVLRTSTINYCLESAATFTLRFQLCSARYTALQMKNSVRIVSAINPVTMENTDDSRLQRTVGKPCIELLQIGTLGCQQKEMGHKEGQR